MQHKHVAKTSLLCAAAAVVLAAAPEEASAQWRRYSAYSCVRSGWIAGNGGADFEWNYNNFETNATGLRNRNTGYTLDQLFCPIEDSDRFPGEQVTTLNLHGWDPGTTFPTQAQACVYFWHQRGNSCGPFVSAPQAGGDYTIQPSRIAWINNPFHFKYFYLTVAKPPQANAAGGEFRGYFIAK